MFCLPWAEHVEACLLPPIPYPLYPIPYTLHAVRYTLYPIRYTLPASPLTPDPGPLTLVVLPPKGAIKSAQKVFIVVNFCSKVRISVNFVQIRTHFYPHF